MFTQLRRYVASTVLLVPKPFAAQLCGDKCVTNCGRVGGRVPESEAWGVFSDLYCSHFFTQFLFPLSQKKHFVLHHPSADDSQMRNMRPFSKYQISSPVRSAVMRTNSDECSDYFDKLNDEKTKAVIVFYGRTVWYR